MSKDEEVILNEEYGPDERYIIYKRHDQRQLILESERRKQNISLNGNFINIIKNIFLPRGFPNSVSKDYTEYQFWDTVQGFCSSISNILAVNSILKGVGVGNAEASALAATITYILKDGAGMVGRITFAWWKGTELDTQCKKWRLRADVLNDLATFLDLLLSFTWIRQYSLIILTFSSCARSIVGVAGGSTRAVLTQHQAIRENMADVSAKDGSQETCINLLAFIIGLAIVPIVDNYLLIIWVIYFTMTALHLFANYKAVKSLNINFFNNARFDLTIKYYLSNDYQNHDVQKPEYINKQEACFFKDEKLFSFQIQLGTSVHHLMYTNKITTWDLMDHIELYKDYLYILIVDKHDKDIIYVILDKNINTENILKAYFHANILSHLIRPKNKLSLDKLNYLLSSTRQTISKNQYCSHYEYIKLACDFVNYNFNKFLLHAKMSDWNCIVHQLIVEEWRASW